MIRTDHTFSQRTAGLTTVRLVEYRVTRPDETLLHTEVAAAYEHRWPKLRPYPPDERIYLTPYPNGYVLPPWRIEARLAGDEDWTLITEATGPDDRQDQEQR